MTRGNHPLKKEGPAPASKQDLYQNTQTQYSSTKEQRKRLLATLRLRPVSTLFARRELDIMHPGGRVMELRKEGFNIITNCRYEETHSGKQHRVAEYILLSPTGDRKL